jgi:hypothetical protein
MIRTLPNITLTKLHQENASVCNHTSLALENPSLSLRTSISNTQHHTRRSTRCNSYTHSFSCILSRNSDQLLQIRPPYSLYPDS